MSQVLGMPGVALVPVAIRFMKCEVIAFGFTITNEEFEDIEAFIYICIVAYSYTWWWNTWSWSWSYGLNECRH